MQLRNCIKQVLYAWKAEQEETCTTSSAEWVSTDIMLTHSSTTDHSQRSEETLSQDSLMHIYKFSVITEGLRTSCDARWVRQQYNDTEINHDRTFYQLFQELLKKKLQCIEWMNWRWFIEQLTSV
jgi:hypothetical protein